MDGTNPGVLLAVFDRPAEPPGGEAERLAFIGVGVDRLAEILPRVARVVDGRVDRTDLAATGVDAGLGIRVLVEHLPDRQGDVIGELVDAVLGDERQAIAILGSARCEHEVLRQRRDTATTFDLSLVGLHVT